MLLYYVRHGDPTYNPDQLTPLGRRQAEAIGHRVTQHGLDVIYVSSSNRAKETAMPACEMLKMQPVELDWTNEHYAWEQLSVIDANGRFTWGFSEPKVRNLFASEEITRLRFEWYKHPFFEGTQFEAGIKRIQKETYAFLKTQGYVWDPERGGYTAEFPNEKRIAMFAHQGFGLAFLSVLMNIPYPQFCVHFDMSHSDLTVIDFEEMNGLVVPKMLMLSNDSHLYRDGLPTRYHNKIYI